MDREVHDLKHEIIDKNMEDVRLWKSDHEIRITSLEKIDGVRNEQIKNILDGLDRTNKSVYSLINWIKWGLAFVIPSTMGFFIWLFQQQLMK